MPVSKRVGVLVYGGGAQRWQAVIQRATPDWQVECGKRQDLSSDYSFVECLVAHRFPEKLAGRLPNLEWIQSLSVGVESFVDSSHIPTNVRITSTRGLYGDAVAEYTLWAMLTLFRKFHRVVKNQQRRKWQPVFGHSVVGKSVGIVGVGDIGTRVARLARAMNMRTIGFVRDGKANGTAEEMDELVAISHLQGKAAEIDALVLALPLTRDTTAVITHDVVSAMHAGAIVVNLSRAGLIEGRAVTDAVAAGKLAGAAIDVFDREPMRIWDSRWKMENLLVTPHTAALRVDFKTRVAELLRENVLRYEAGRPLLNEVERPRGY